MEPVQGLSPWVVSVVVSAEVVYLETECALVPPILCVNNV